MSDALKLVLEQAEAARDEALVAFQQAQARATQARAQCQDLGQYQQQYDARWLAQFRQGGAAVQIVQAHQQFGLRLTDAIGQQTQAAAMAETRAEAARQLLQERELRVASVRKLMERRQAEQQLKDQRREQKASDEFAAQRHRQNP
jgi:flagellar protein FliJ